MFLPSPTRQFRFPPLGGLDSVSVGQATLDRALNSDDDDFKSVSSGLEGNVFVLIPFY